MCLENAGEAWESKLGPHVLSVPLPDASPTVSPALLSLRAWGREGLERVGG